VKKGRRKIYKKGRNMEIKNVSRRGKSDISREGENIFRAGQVATKLKLKTPVSISKPI
jgi:hypothetical protein